MRGHKREGECAIPGGSARLSRTTVVERGGGGIGWRNSAEGIVALGTGLKVRTVRHRKLSLLDRSRSGIYLIGFRF